MGFSYFFPSYSFFVNGLLLFFFMGWGLLFFIVGFYFKVGVSERVFEFPFDTLGVLDHVSG